MTTQEHAARQSLDVLVASLATLAKMARDTEPLYCRLTDLTRLEVARTHLQEAEDLLAEVCAWSVEQDDNQ
jgi:hypothetical protein